MAPAADSDDPAAELASFKLAPGFAVNLFASEADGVVKPIQSRFDPRGRLWVIGSTVYPQLKPGEVPNDKVLILEDTDRDGRADRSTVFADGLLIPTGLEITADGCLVGNSTELLRLRDTDGDDVADVREVVLRGFGTGDNHQNLNSFLWGPAGELWFSQGLHSYSRVETPWGIQRLDAAGLWRLWPRRLRLDAFFGHELPPHNPWGFVFDDWNQMFVVAGNGHGIYWPLPICIRGHRVTPLDQIWHDFRGRKVSGADIVGNAHLPEDWQGVMLAGGYLNHAVFALRLSDDGAGFRAEDLPPLLTSTHGSFRPVDVKIGPDGAVYVTDWYNPIIGHYQASFRHPDRDKTHGRIWRITATGRPLLQPPRLVGAALPALLDHLKSTDRFTRHQAKRVLADRDTREVTAALAAWLKTLDPRDPLYERHLMEALGVFESHEVVEPALLAQLLRAKDPRARAYAAGVVAHWQDRLADPLGLLRPLVTDAHLRVRVAAVVAAAYVPDAEAVTLALAAIDPPPTPLANRGPEQAAAATPPAEHPPDKWLDYAVRQAVFALKPHWLPALTNGRLDLTAQPRRLEFLVRADASPDTLRVLRATLASGRPSPATREALLGILAETGGPEDLALLLDPKAVAHSGEGDPRAHARLLQRLHIAARARGLRPAGDLAAALRPLATEPSPPELRTAALRLAALWKVEPLADIARQTALGPTADAELCLAAATALAATRGELAAEDLAALAAADRPADQRAAGVAALAQIDPTRAAAAAAALLCEDLPERGIVTILSAFLQRQGAADSFVQALRAQPPSRDNARLALRWANSVGVADRSWLAAFTAAAGLDTEPLRAEPEFVRDLSAEVRAHGDAVRGREVFRRADLGCQSCHRVDGEGGTTGPDLSAIGSGQPLDFIIGAVLEPGREVKENYEAIEVITADDESYVGYRVAGAAEGEFALHDVARNEVVRLPRAAVREILPRGSLMPAGLVNHLTRAELRDLFRYLSELGKPKR